MKYFTYSELLHSDKAVSKRIANRANKEQEDNLQSLVDNVLDPLRAMYGKPINVSSGFRNSKVNALVGGASTSDHLKGCAADISAGSREENRKLMRMIADYFSFKQLIDENNFAWVHVSFVADDNRHEILRIRGGKTTRIGKEDI